VNIIIDANLVAATVLPLPYSDQATQKITTWKHTGAELLAPLLLEYEVVAALRRAVVAGLMTTDFAVKALGQISALNIQCTPPTSELHRQALRWADRLGHSKAYDAQYVALAEQQQAELWTADRRLANGTDGDARQTQRQRASLARNAKT
jgi:predicted nucleic acid-binding protein